MKCDAETMLKIGLGLALLVGVGLLIFPQLRFGVVLLLPFAPLAICLAMCPLMMYFGMRNDDNKSDHTH